MLVCRASLPRNGVHLMGVHRNPFIDSSGPRTPPLVALMSNAVRPRWSLATSYCNECRMALLWLQLQPLGSAGLIHQLWANRCRWGKQQKQLESAVAELR